MTTISPRTARRRVPPFTVVITPLLCWLSIAPAAAQSTAEASTTSQILPVAVNIEGRKVSSSMSIEVAMESYDAASIATLREKTLDPVEASYLQLLEGVKANDLERAGKSLVGGETEGVGQRVQMLRTAFGDMQSPRSIARLDLGTNQVFVWDWQSPRGLERRAFEFDVDSRRGRLVTSNQPLATLLLDIFQNQADDPSSFEPLASAATRFSYRLPLEGTEVTWHFDGEALDFDLYGGEAPPAIPALEALHAAHQALGRDDVDTYLAAHTPASRDKLGGWISAMPAEEYASFKMTTLLPKRVRFVLDADPVHLVFFHYDLGAMAQEPKLAWLYVYRDPASGELLLANAYREAFLDDFLKDESLIPRNPAAFVQRVLGLGG